jgi:hypothetical protein
MRIIKLYLSAICIFLSVNSALYSQNSADSLRDQPFEWKSAAPDDCPFKPSTEIKGIRLLGIKSGFHYGDTWYPCWASDGNLYSPWTDGTINGIKSWSSGFSNNGEKILENPPGSHYGMVFQKFEFISIKF